MGGKSPTVLEPLPLLIAGYGSDTDSPTPAGDPMIQLNADTIYPETASDPTH